ncbi:MAG: zinc-ribbon domain-containing protein [Candidatus Omnitrophica bacterium]|nr:zinc-ribbon domain-containing protein [Candidatus Omnitrophota bacterium]
MGEYDCPHCGMMIIDDDALLCHHCGQSLERAGHGFLGRVRYSNRKVAFFFVIFIILLAFAALMVIYN